jgi:hypothetical protein
MRFRDFATVLVCASFLESAYSPAFAGNVLVVDAHAHGQFRQIQPAVDAALDGDAILVKTGIYPGFTVTAKGLSITADAGHLVIVTSPVGVVDVAASSTVLIAGLEIHSNSASVPTLDLRNISGSVRIQTCTIRGFTASCCVDGSPAVGITSAVDAALDRCTLQGGSGTCLSSSCESATAGGSALVVESSQVALYDCILIGGAGGDTTVSNCYGSPAGTGGTSCIVTNGFLFASNTRVEGGTGGRGANADNGDCNFPCWPEDGGTGGGCIHVTTAAPPFPNVVLFADALTPGPGGVGGHDTSGFCGWDGDHGHPGNRIVAPAGSVHETSGLGRRLAAPGVARENQSIPFNLHGDPGEVVWIYFASRPGFTFDPSMSGVSLTDPSPPTRLVRLGTLPVNGTLDTQIRLPDLGVDSKTFFIQAVFGDPSSGGHLGTPLTLVELDSAF